MTTFTLAILASGALAGRRLALRFLAVAGVALALGACGGHDDGIAPPSVAPTVVGQPADQSVVAGSAATFAVDATGDGPLSYQWSSSGDGATFTAIAGATGSSHATGPTSTAQNGTFYRVAVGNAAGSVTSSAARLSVAAAAAPPTVGSQPDNQTVTAPATATFQITVTGTPTPTVQWQQSTDAGATWSAIAGATAATYTTPATAIADNGKRFRVVISNGSGSVNSNAAILTVTSGASTQIFNSPYGVVIGPAGEFYAANASDHTILRITPAGVASVFAGSPGLIGTADGTGGAARFRVPRGLAIDAAGNLYVADTTNVAIRKITPAGVVTTLAGLAGSGGSADGTGSAARFSAPWGVAVDAAGNVYVADSGNNLTVRKITPAGVVTTLAGAPGNPGNLGVVDGTGSAARFSNLSGIAVDAAGTVYVTDRSHTIRRISPAGVVTTIAGMVSVVGSADGAGSAARFQDPQGVAVDGAGNLVVSDTANNTVRTVTAAGVVGTLAGTALTTGNVNATGSAARFNRPRGLTVDAAGNVYVADTGNNALRRITPAGVVTTFLQ